MYRANLGVCIKILLLKFLELLKCWYTRYPYLLFVFRASLSVVCRSYIASSATNKNQINFRTQKLSLPAEQQPDLSVDYFACFASFSPPKLSDGKFSVWTVFQQKIVFLRKFKLTHTLVFCTSEVLQWTQSWKKGNDDQIFVYQNKDCTGWEANQGSFDFR
jgi:hypothetical protein